MHPLIARPPNLPRTAGLLTLPSAQVAAWQTAHLHRAWWREVQDAVTPPIPLAEPASLPALYAHIHTLLDYVNTTLFPIMTLTEWEASEDYDDPAEALTTYRDYFGDLIPFCIQGIHHDDSPDDMDEPLALLYRLLDLEFGGPALQAEIEAQYGFVLPPDFRLPSLYATLQAETGVLEQQVARTLAVLARSTDNVFLDSCPCGEHLHELYWERDNVRYLTEQWQAARPFEQAQTDLMTWFAAQPSAEGALAQIWSIFARLHLQQHFEDEYGYRVG